jgi:hypothetical protein
MVNKHKHNKASWLLRVMLSALSALITAFIIVVPGCTQEKPPASPEPAIAEEKVPPSIEPVIATHFISYTDTDEPALFSISYPADWELDLAQTELLERLSQEELE